MAETELVVQMREVGLDIEQAHRVAGNLQALDQLASEGATILTAGADRIDLLGGSSAELRGVIGGLDHYAGPLLANLGWLMDTADALVVAQSADQLAELEETPLPPVNTVPGPQTIRTGLGASIAGVSVADPRHTTTHVELTFDRGIMSVTNSGFVQGNGTERVTIEGSLFLANQALGGLAVMAMGGYVGPALLTMTSTNPEPLQATSTIDVTVTA